MRRDTRPRIQNTTMGAQEWGPYSGIKDNEEGYSPKNTEYNNGGPGVGAVLRYKGVGAILREQTELV